MLTIKELNNLNQEIMTVADVLHLCKRNEVDAPVVGGRLVFVPVGVEPCHYNKKAAHV